MTFDEAIKYAKENSFVEEMLSDVVELEDVIEILEKLKKEYAPTVEMTKKQKQLLDSYREPGLFDGDYTFNAFYEDTHAHRLGMREHNLYDNLTETQLMRAWLHPETIKIIGDERYEVLDND